MIQAWIDEKIAHRIELSLKEEHTRFDKRLKQLV